MRFFDFNYAFLGFGCTYTASSNSALADSAFDELDRTYWASSGEGTDGNAIYLECDFGTNRSFNRIFVKDTNIENLSANYWNGSSWVTVGGTLTVSEDGTSGIFEFPAITTTKFRIEGSDTITPNEEKTINEVYAFEEIGRLVIPPADIQVKRVKIQDKHQLDNGKYYIFTKGRRWEITLSFKAHIGQADIDLISSLVDRDLEFYVWINDNEESVMVQKTEPFTFGTMLKLSLDGGDSPEYYKNLFFSGVDNKIKLVEVA